jgi:hypothetical protein
MSNNFICNYVLYAVLSGKIPSRLCDNRFCYASLAMFSCFYINFFSVFGLVSREDFQSILCYNFICNYVLYAVLSGRIPSRLCDYDICYASLAMLPCFYIIFFSVFDLVSQDDFQSILSDSTLSSSALNHAFGYEPFHPSRNSQRR